MVRYLEQGIVEIELETIEYTQSQKAISLDLPKDGLMLETGGELSAVLIDLRKMDYSTPGKS